MTDNSFIERESKLGTTVGRARRDGGILRRNMKDPDDKFHLLHNCA